MKSELQVHPVAELFPMMSKSELEDMAQSIKKEGLLNPIVVKDGTLIDGRNRLAACKIAEVEPRYEEYKGKDIVQFIISSNIKRRHLDEGQKALIAVGIANIEKHSNRFSTKVDEKVDRTRVLSTFVETAPITQDQAAEAMGVSSRSVKRAKVITTEGSEGLVQAVKDSKVDLYNAEKLAKQDIVIQEKVVEAITAGKAKNVKQALNDIKREERKNTVKSLDITNVFNGDAVEVLKNLKDKSIDCVLTDPPYGVDYKDARESYNTKYKDEKEYALELLDNTCKELKRIAKDDAHLYFFTGFINAFEFKNILSKYFIVQENPIVWVKNNHTLCDFTKRYASKYEMIWFCKNNNDNRILNYKCSEDVLNYAIPTDKQHSAQKPIELLKYIIGNSTVEGEIVLDPFAGSGSTGVAAKVLKRNYTLIELEKENYELIIENLGEQ